MAKAMTSRMSGAAVRISLVEDNPGDVYLLEKALLHHHIDYEFIYKIAHGYYVRIPARAWYTWRGELLEDRGVQARPNQ